MFLEQINTTYLLSSSLGIARVTSIIIWVSRISASARICPISAVSVSPWSPLTSASITPILLTRLVGIGVLRQLSRYQLTKHSSAPPATSRELGYVTINVESIVAGIISIAGLLKKVLKNVEIFVKNLHTSCDNNLLLSQTKSLLDAG